MLTLWKESFRVDDVLNIHFAGINFRSCTKIKFFVGINFRECVKELKFPGKIHGISGKNYFPYKYWPKIGHGEYRKLSRIGAESVKILFPRKFLPLKAILA